MQENKHAGGFFLKNNKRAGQNKAVQGGFFSKKSRNVHACLFGTLEYIVLLDNVFKERSLSLPPREIHRQVHLP